MKVIICLSFLACCAFVFGKPSDDHYTTKYDNIDIDAIIKNDRLLRAYVDCLKGTKKCNKDGEELKKVVPDALKTGCSKCNDTQREKTKKMMHHLIKNKRDWFRELEAIYDPEGTYKKKYDAEAKKEGLKLD